MILLQAGCPSAVASICCQRRALSQRRSTKKSFIVKRHSPRAHVAKTELQTALLSLLFPGVCKHGEIGGIEAAICRCVFKTDIYLELQSKCRNAADFSNNKSRICSVPSYSIYGSTLFPQHLWLLYVHAYSINTSGCTCMHLSLCSTHTRVTHTRKRTRTHFAHRLRFSSPPP